MDKVVVIHKHNAEKAGLHYDFRFEFNKDKAMSIVLRDKPSIFLKNGYTSNCVYTFENIDVLDITDMTITEGYGKGTLELIDVIDADISINENKIKILMKDLEITIIRFTDKICRFIVNEQNK